MISGVSIDCVRDAISRDIKYCQAKLELHQGLVNNFKKEIDKLIEVEKEATRISQQMKMGMGR